MEKNKKFVLAPDPDSQELFLIHKQHPACLIKIIDTKPVTLRIIDMFEEIPEGAVLEYSFLEEAKLFLKKNASNILVKA